MNMRATATTFPKYMVRQSSATAHRIYTGQNLRNRIRYFIEATDWDRKLMAQEKWINKICLGIIIFSVLYFVPVIVISFMK
jgi:hypothetical protein